MITLECNYSKKIGLPQYSSHQFSITLRTEITDVAQLQAESSRVYGLLQQSVDASLKQVGFLPEKPEQHHGSNGNGYHRQSGNPRNNWRTQRTGYRNNTPANDNKYDQEWNCSLKQKELILNIIQENKLDKREVERLSQDLFSKGVRLLNKLEASGLIDEMLRQYSNTGDQQPQTTRA